MPEVVEIKGGADPYVTAAIMAALQVLWDEETEGVEGAGPLTQAAWVMSGRARRQVGPRSDERQTSLRATEDRNRRRDTR
ncbi:MAG: hypothetical protein ACE5MI_09060 [Acidimicrobiia bacterium]